MIQGGVAEVNAKEPGRLQVVYEGYAPEDATDFSAVLTAALAKKPDIIHMDAADPPWMALVIKQARELGYKGWFISGGGQTLSTLLEVAGKAFAYNIITPSWSFERPCPVSVPAGQEANWKKFCDMYGDWTWLAEAWKTEYKEDLPGAVIYGNDAFNTEIMGILAADSFDTDKVVTALEDMEYVPTYFGMGTWMGKETWGQNHQIRRPITLYIIQNGELFPVEPPVMPAYYP
jgi:branched-chain amino acid transport system substrate-binding protein